MPEEYPDTIVIEGEPYDRQDLPGEAGIPYARRTDMGGLRLLVRVDLVECPRCGKPLFQVVQGDNKGYHCGGGNCGRWRLRLVKEAGRALMLALVMES